MYLTKLSLIVAGLSICAALSAQTKKSYYVEKPGTLVELLTEEEAKQITHLTLYGKLNAIDFRRLRDDFTNLRVLDISKTIISAYSGKLGTYPNKFNVYAYNAIPAYAFCRPVNDTTFVGKTSLRKIILPEKTARIEVGAFKGCTKLRVCQIRKKSAPNLMEDALDEGTAVFVPLGCGDEYRDKKRWEDLNIVEGEPLNASVTISATSSLSNELAKQGLRPNDINFLTVEGKMDGTDFSLIRDYMPNLVKVNLSKTNATTIPEFTFTQKKYLMSIRLPAKLKTIGQRAFSGCTHLRGAVILPSTVTAIEYGAFIGCDNLQYVVATGDQITTLGDNLFGEFNNNKLTYSRRRR